MPQLDRTRGQDLREQELRSVARDGECYAEVRWGRRLAAVAVTLERVGEAELRELLSDAWEGKAGAAARGPR